MKWHLLHTPLEMLQAAHQVSEWADLLQHGLQHWLDNLQCASMLHMVKDKWNLCRPSAHLHLETLALFHSLHG